MENLDGCHVSNNHAEVCLVVEAAHLVLPDPKLGAEEDSPVANWLSILVHWMTFAAIGFVSPLVVKVVPVVVVLGFGGKITVATGEHLFISYFSCRSESSYICLVV